MADEDTRAGPRPGGVQGPDDAYLRDCAALLDAVPYPSVLFDRRWDVVLANPAYDALFSAIGPHPTAMPRSNFLRFVLFHPDAATVLGDHEHVWCLPLLAHFARALEKDSGDPRLRSVRADIAADPIMEAAYAHGLPHWVHAVGECGLEYDGAVRALVHPDPRWGATTCRVVGDTPATLRAEGFTRLTFVLHEPPRPGPHSRVRRQSRRPVRHLRALPMPGA